MLIIYSAVTPYGTFGYKHIKYITQSVLNTIHINKLNNAMQQLDNAVVVYVNTGICI